MRRGVLFLDFYCSLVPFLNEYTKQKLKYQSKALTRKIRCTNTNKMQVNGVCLYLHKSRDEIFNIAAINGYGKLCDYMILSEKTNRCGVYILRMGLWCAAYGGHRLICKKMIEMGAKNYSDALMSAAMSGHLEICKKMNEFGAKNLNLVFSHAAGGGYLDICEWVKGLGATDFDDALTNAGICGHLDICEWAIGYGANFNRAFRNVDDKTKEYLREKLLAV